MFEPFQEKFLSFDAETGTPSARFRDLHECSMNPKATAVSLDTMTDEEFKNLCKLQPPGYIPDYMYGRKTAAELLEEWQRVVDPETGAKATTGCLRWGDFIRNVKQIQTAEEYNGFVLLPREWR